MLKRFLERTVIHSNTGWSVSITSPLYSINIALSPKVKKQCGSEGLRKVSGAKVMKL